MSEKNFSLIIMFDDGLENVLLLERKKAPFAGMLNGLGGKKEINETWDNCAVRELQEESGLTKGLDYDTLLPVHCVKEDNFAMHVFAGVVSSNWQPGNEDLREGKLCMVNVTDVFSGKLQGQLADNMELYIAQSLQVI